MVWKKCRMVAAVRTTVVLEPIAKDLPQAFPPTVSPAASADRASVATIFMNFVTKLVG